MNYCIIIPAHNEEKFIALALQSIMAQTFLPKKVVVVNDHSNDNTEAIINEFSSKSDWIVKVNVTSSQERLPGSKVINAFNQGLKRLDAEYDFIVKLDADIVLPDTYFESIASIFNSNEKIGIAGGFAYEKEQGEWKLNHPMSKNHVRGAFKAYSKACFEAIDGLKDAMGWDTIDELLAMYHGFEVYTIDTLKVKHLRPTGVSYHQKAKFMQGEAMYSMRYGFLLTSIASAKMALKQHRLSAFSDNLKGYWKAKKRKTPFSVTEDEGVFIRNYRYKNIFKRFFWR
jgi:glycosyltransferase involved in cell wall biosynthesis